MNDHNALIVLAVVLLWQQLQIWGLRSMLRVLINAMRNAMENGR